MNPSELIEALRDADDEQRQEIKQLLSSQTRKTTRRGLMTAGAGVLSWLAVGQAAGQTNLPRSACEWAGNTDANGYDLLNLNALEGTGITGGERLTNIAGTNLTIDADGNLNASGGSSAGALTDSGTDTDGGDDYVLPNAADNIDLQGDGAIQNADTISGTSATLQSLSADQASITGVEQNVKNVLADVEAPPTPEWNYRYTTVDTSDTTIIDLNEGGIQALIFGMSGLDRFVDHVTAIAFGGVSVTSPPPRGSPANRSYSVSSNDLVMSMDSGSYDVAVKTFRHGDFSL